MSLIPIIGATGEGGIVDVDHDGRKVTFTLSPGNALPMAEIMASKQPVPLLIAALQLSVLAECEGRGVSIKLRAEP